MQSLLPMIGSDSPDFLLPATPPLSTSAEHMAIVPLSFCGIDFGGASLRDFACFAVWSVSCKTAKQVRLLGHDGICSMFYPMVFISAPCLG